MRIGILWAHFGPYHLARLRAVGRQCDLVGIEISGESDHNSWDRIHGAEGFRRVTLFAGVDSDRLPPRTVLNKLFGILDTLNLDVICVPNWSDNTSLGALHWSLRRGVPAVCMPDSTEIDYPRTLIKEFVKRQILRCFAAAFVSGQSCAAYVNKLGIPRDRIFMGMDVVDNDHFSSGSDVARADRAATLASLGLPPKYFITLSRLIPKKNHECVLRAFARFRSLRPNDDTKLVVVGEGPRRAELCELAVSLGIADEVMFVGNQGYQRVPALLGLAEALLHASFSEQWGLVVNEAMAAGLPILVSERCGCARDLVENGVNGFTFDPFASDELCDRMLLINDDADLRLSMSIASRRVADRWSLEVFSQNLLKAIGSGCSRGFVRASPLSRLAIRLLMYRKNPTDVGEISVDPRLRPAITVTPQAEPLKMSSSVH